jgi:hypothetical protein
VLRRSRKRIGKKRVSMVAREKPRSRRGWDRWRPQKMSGFWPLRVVRTMPTARAVPGRRGVASQAHKPRRDAPMSMGRVVILREGDGVLGWGWRRKRRRAKPPKRRKARAEAKRIVP